ncbi:MAG TPA: caspase family protein [Chitinispirillaceae bacterium]|nr:caspase family protein [Chitinispirillaceae bacterium]
MKRVILCAFIFTLFFQAHGARYALLAGRNDGGRSVEPLKFAQSDAHQLADLLTGSGGFMAADIKLLASPDSTRLSDALNHMRKIAEGAVNDSDNLFIFYYSGHADENGLLLGEQHFSFDRIYQTLSAITHGVRIGIFDACYSGVVTAFKGGKGADPLYFQRIQSVKGQVIIASSAAHERAQESASLKSSIFTFHLCNGLRGSADISGDKKVTLTEAYQYAYRKTIETSALTSGEIQHPVYKFNIQGQGDIVLTSFSSKSSGLLFDKNTTGKYLVLSENYLDVFADFYKDKGQEHFIALGPGKYTVIRAYQREVGTAAVSLNGPKTKRIRDNMLAPDFITESRVKGTAIQDTNKAAAIVPIVPLSNFSASIGTGISLKFQKNAPPSRNAFLELSGKWYINDHLDFSLDLTGYPASKDISVVPGALFVPGRERRFQFFSGGGAGFMYDYQSGGSDDAFFLIAIQNGVVMQLGRNSMFSVTVPFSIGFDSKTAYRSGLKFSLLLFK